MSNRLRTSVEKLAATRWRLAAPALLLALYVFSPEPSPGIELRDAELVAAGTPVMQDAAGSVRLEDGRLGRLGPTILVPEPDAFWMLGCGGGFLVLLGQRCRERRGGGRTTASWRGPARFALLSALLFVVVATPAAAQVPQDMTYTGRLVDSGGVPIAGPVNMKLRIFDAATSGTEIYSEDHLGVTLDATGGFSVQFGLGTNPSEPFRAIVFSSIDRWLEVEVAGAVLTPRQILGAVPWALIAEQAEAIVRDPAKPRFEDCEDGTVADHRHGLQWEVKTGSITTPLDCTTSIICPDPHDVNYRYSWSANLPDADGEIFSDFLARLNGFDPAGCLAKRCDWRLPEYGEFKTIMIGPDAGPGQLLTCPSGPCVDAAFAALAGPTVSDFYWSNTTLLGNSPLAFYASFQDGTMDYSAFNKTLQRNVRAVRSGTCH